MKSFTSIAGLLFYQSKKLKNKVFLKFEEKEYSYQRFNSLTTQLACCLKKMGVKKGTLFCASCHNCPEFLLLWFALNKLGAILVPLNPNYKANEARFILKHTKAEYCLVTSKTNQVIKKVAGKCKLLTMKNLRGLLTKNINLQKNFPDNNLNDIASILYTSGTTGKPKGVILANRSYIVGGESFAMRARLSNKDKIMVVLPLFHVNAQVYSTIGCLVAGATLILKPKFSASNFWKDVISEKITQFNIIGAMAHILLEYPLLQKKKHQVRVAFGGAFSKKCIKRFKDKFGIPLLESYSLTESPMVASNLLDDNKIGSIGKPAKHPNKKFLVKIKIVNEKGIEVKKGGKGEIAIKSPALTLGYFKNKQANIDAFKNGWFYTGDYGKEDKQGYFYFIDRKKDIIRKKGQNMSSRQIEEVIGQMDEIKEVAVIPVPAPLGEDNIKACVVLKPKAQLTAQQVKNFCQKNLADFKTPDFVEFLKQLPKTPTQKIAKNRLKKDFITSLNKIDSDIYILDGIRTPISKLNGQFKNIPPKNLLQNCLNWAETKYQFKNSKKTIINYSSPSYRSKNIFKRTVDIIKKENDRLVIIIGVNPFTLARKQIKKHKTKSFIKTMFIKAKSLAYLAQTLSRQFNITRQDQDQYSYQCYQRTLKSSQQLKKEILNVDNKGRDELFYQRISLETLSSLKPLCKKSSFTLGNMSLPVKGAGFLLFCSKNFALKKKIKPLAKMIDTNIISNRNFSQGLASTHSINELLNKNSLTLDDISIIELHEPTALQALVCLAQLRISPHRVGFYGSSISLGDLSRNTAIRLLLTASLQLKDKKAKYALISSNIGNNKALSILLKKV